MAAVDPHLWQQIIQHVVAQGGQIIRPWFAQLQPLSLEHGQLHIQAPGPEELSYCQDHASALFTEAAQAATGRLVSTSFQAVPLADLETGAAAGPLAAQPESDSPLNADYTFENFVAGPCSRLAHAACLAVAESPGKAYNPLFVHGSAGLGKTHLLQAVCQTVLARGEAKISFLSCETFVNHLIRAIETGGLHDFRYRYRHVDVLAVDDVQFLSNHDQTQEEFFHTFNTLYQSQKQIILSCDRPPSEIPHLEERLVSRFNWGLVAGVDRPGYETRMAIVHKKAHARDVQLPSEVVCFIAGAVQSSARELEGAITKVAMLAQVYDRPITLELAEEALGTTQALGQREVTIEQIIDAVTKRYGVRLADLQGRKRTKSISLPRQVCMYLARALTRHSLEEIGAYFGGRDHTTVLHGKRTIESMRHKDASLNAALEQLGHQIREARA